jgi:predicted secreted protein
MKAKRLFVLSAMLLVPVLLGGCPLLQRGQTIFLDVQDDSSNVTAQVGDRLIVGLRATPSSGYSWQTTTIDTESLEFVQEQFLFDNASDLAGAPGTSVLEFKAVAAGSSTLELGYSQAGAPTGTPPAQTFSVNVLVE